ncbi:MAG: hypothetical protein M3463_05470, partial [Verrucomicrobiota bacterium]|nr:hypothetical protein [Verrucomicrobiota bacterium]
MALISAAVVAFIIVRFVWRAASEPVSDSTRATTSSTGPRSAQVAERAVRSGQTGKIPIVLYANYSLIAGLAAVALLVVFGAREISTRRMLGPMYEKGVIASGPDQPVRVDALRFQFKGITRADSGRLLADIGPEGLFDVVEIRVFDHSTRTLLHDTGWENRYRTNLAMRATRQGESGIIMLTGTDFRWPERIDLWLQVAQPDSQRPIVRTRPPSRSAGGNLPASGEPEVVWQEARAGTWSYDARGGAITWREDSQHKADTTCTVVF